MIVYLSLVLNLKAKRLLDLRQGTLKEIDEFVTSFDNHEQIRSHDVFRPIIEKYLMEEKDYINTFKKDRDRRGRFMINYIDVDLDNSHDIHAVPIIYSKDKRFMNVNYDFKLLKEYLLNNSKKLIELVQAKAYLFSEYEINTIYNAFKINRRKEYEAVINMIIANFKKHKDPYFYVRSFLEFYRNFESKKKLPNQIKTKHGVISHIDRELIDLSKRRDKLEVIEDVSDYSYFDKSIQEGDYEELYNLYSLDEIIARSSDRDNPLGQVYRKSQ